MIKYIKGDLFETDAEIIAHGCNCLGGFGSGIAGIIAKRYPEVRKQYLDKFNSVGWNLGDVQIVQVKDKIFINCATQLSYGGEAKNGKIYVDYEAIKSCMKKVYDYKKGSGLKIAIPKIGAGLAGGDWTKIEKIINDVFIDEEIVVYVL